MICLVSAQIPFRIIAEACQQTRSSVILIGGQAVSVRGYLRTTIDIDFIVTDKDYEKLKPVICGKGYQETVRTAVAARLSAESEDLIDIDFIFVEEETFKGIQKESKAENFQGVPILVPKTEHLIALKLHAIKQQPSRELRDLNDIVELIQANRIDVSSGSFKSLCLKFGTPALHEKILTYAKSNG